MVMRSIGVVNGSRLCDVVAFRVQFADLGREKLLDWPTILISLASFAVTFYFKKLNTAFVVIGGAGLGYVLSLI